VNVRAQVPAQIGGPQISVPGEVSLHPSLARSAALTQGDPSGCGEPQVAPVVWFDARGMQAPLTQSVSCSQADWSGSGAPQLPARQTIDGSHSAL
jgi:hypothetical protein